MSIAVCLVSGGLDSCVAAAEAKARGWQLAFFHACYGQLTEGRELRAFHEIADHFRVEHRLVADLRFLSHIGGSALTDRKVPLPEHDDRSLVPASYVPFRNAILLAAATSWGEVLGATDLFIGAVEADGSCYPDCRGRFFDKFQAAIAAGTRQETRIQLQVPLISLSKSEIVRRGVSLSAPLEMTWSCYRASREACGSCRSCRSRLAGFDEAGLRDPIPYCRTEAATP